MSEARKTTTVVELDRPTETNLLGQILDRMDALAAAPRVSPIGIRTFDELVRYAERAAKTDMVPVNFKGKPDAIIVAIQFGSELGLSPMQSLISVAVINNRPGIWGDALPGLCKASPHFEDMQEHFEGSGDNLTAVCVAKRKGKAPVVQRFSVADARQAGLLGKQGPWQQYLKRMLQMRARSFALRDAFPDVLRGIKGAEELLDTPADVSDEFRTTYGGTVMHAEPTPQSGATEPEPPKKRTIGDMLDALQRDLDAAQTANMVDAIIARDDVQKMADYVTNGARDRFNEMVKAAIDRTHRDAVRQELSGDSAEDDFPGEVTR